MAGQQLEGDQKDGGKRKLELADQNPQEIPAPAAEAKRRKIDIHLSERKPPSFPVPSTAQSNQNPVENKRIMISEGKIGLVIGKGGETIQQIQLQSGANVQIAKEHEADIHNLTRAVDLTGTSEQISRAEELINAAISKEANAASSAVHGSSVNQSEGKQFTVEVKVPDDKVGLLIGTGGETIKYMQRKSGADLKVSPPHLHAGCPPTERIVYITGTAEQIEAAKKIIDDVVHRKWISEPSVSSAFAQPSSGNRAPPPQPGHHPTDVSYYDQSQMTSFGYYGPKPQISSAPFVPSCGSTQQAPNYAGNTTAQAVVPGPYGQPEGPVSSQSTEPASTYPPFWSSKKAGPPASWQTDSGYDPTVHWWEQTPLVPPLSTQATGEQDESQQPSKNDQSRSPATRPETRDENS